VEKSVLFWSLPQKGKEYGLILGKGHFRINFEIKYIYFRWLGMVVFAPKTHK
jgi:hypothetical protein